MSCEATLTLRSTHLHGAQALPVAGVEGKALSAGSSAHHAPWTVGGAVEGGSVSQQRLCAASLACTGTVGTAVDKREGISQGDPTLC